jgi:orotidine-5'-phosphate decarboxylase
MAHFADRLNEAIEAKGNPCTVGLDPRLEMIPECLRDEIVGGRGWDCETATELVRVFCREVIDIVAPLVPVVKVQAAFFERLGPLGYGAFADAIRHAKRKGLIVIADVKRSDIGSTAAAYAEATVGSGVAFGVPLFELGADACTVNPYLGWDGVEPFVREAARHDRGLFILVRTTNPSADQVQGLACKGVPLFMRVGALVHRWGQEYIGNSGFSLVGAVVGGTYPIDAEKLRRLMPNAIFLVPGFGAQGAKSSDVAKTFNEEGRGAIVSSSRSITFAHTRPPFDRQFGQERWREAIAAATQAMIREIERVV